MSTLLSLSEALPAKTATPFLGVCLYSLKALIALSSESMTLFLVLASLILDAVPCSSCRCPTILSKLYPAGAYTLTNSVCLPLIWLSSRTISLSFFLSFMSILFYPALLFLLNEFDLLCACHSFQIIYERHQSCFKLFLYLYAYWFFHRDLLFSLVFPSSSYYLYHHIS